MSANPIPIPEQAMTNAAWISLRAAARLLKATPYTVNRASARGAIRAMISPLSGALVFSRDDVERIAAELDAAV
jgi:hypothetical protein